MTNAQAPAQGQPRPLPPQQAAAIQGDQLLKVLMEEFPRDRARIRRIDPNDVRRLVTELDGTVMSHLQDQLQWLVRIRNWAAEELNEVHTAMQALSDEVEDLREAQSMSGGDTGLDSEELEKLLKLCGGTKAIVELVLQKRGQKLELDAEQVQVVEAQAVLADECLKVLSAYEVEGSDDASEEQAGE
jgi:ribosome-binding ATPase YchF (GTP1/OBG family)